VKTFSALVSSGWAGRWPRLALLLLVPVAAWAQAGTAALPRFVDNGNGTVTDGRTGLTWEQAPSSDTMSQPDSVRYAGSLSLAGFTDWRLPSQDELSSLVDPDEPDIAAWLTSHGFKGITPADYWTATLFLFMGYDDADHTYAYVVDMSDGWMRQRLVKDYVCFARAVRGPPWHDRR
jgi:hypothetical protein